MIMYAIILQEVIFIVSVELPTIILGPLELFLSELHTHIQCSLLLSSYHFLYAIQVKKQNCLYFCTEKYELKLDDMSYYILYTFQTPMFTLFLPNCQVRVTFLC